MATPQVKKTLTTVTQASIAQAVADAKAYLKTTPDVNYIVDIPSGMWDLTEPGNKAAIDVSGVVAGSQGRFILRGAGMESTTLVTNDDLLGVNGSSFNRVTVRDMHLTRPHTKVSQGVVVSVAPLTLKIQPGFPDPMSIHSGESGKGAGRYLRKFTNSATDPQLVTANNDQIGWEDATQVSPGVWQFRQNAGPTPSKVYKPGDLVAIKSKHGADAYKFSDGTDIYFKSVKWTEESRGAFRHVNKVHVADCKILRAPAIQGQVPCLSTPDGGPQVGQPGDQPISGAMVEHCTFVGTGDDGIACFNAYGIVRNNYIQDAFARGINIYATNGISPVPKPDTSQGNVTVRCAIEDTSYNQRT